MDCPIEPINQGVLRKCIALVQSTLSEGLQQGRILDIAFLGSTSEAYPWKPAMIVDVDVWVLVDSLNSEVGNWLQSAAADLAPKIQKLGCDFELRVVSGPYKPARWVLHRPIVLAHVLVDNCESYSKNTILALWAWRKYRCLVRQDRLAHMAPRPISCWDVLHAPYGVKDCMKQIAHGKVTMPQRNLPALDPTRLEFGHDQPEFIEFCFYAATTSARNHARALGFMQPDALSNDDYFRWYTSTLVNSAELLELVRVKDLARVKGYAVAREQSAYLALTWLRKLEEELSSPRGKLSHKM